MTIYKSETIKPNTGTDFDIARNPLPLTSALKAN
jgi:hypothetical protein